MVGVTGNNVPNLHWSAGTHRVRSSGRSALPWELALLIVSLVALQRFGIPLGSTPFFVTLPLGGALLAVSLFRGNITFDREIASLFMVSIAVLFVIQFASYATFSITSLMEMAVLMALYTLQSSAPQTTFFGSIVVYRNIMIVFSTLGIIQFFSQFVVPIKFVFPIDYFVPKNLIVPNMNFIIPLSYGLQKFKSNGYVFIEPSVFSQCLAFAFIIELQFFRSFLVLGLIFLAMLLSFSGTGFVLLGCALLPLIVDPRLRKTILRAIIALAALLVVVYVFGGDTVGLNLLFGRAGEVTSQGSSGHARFIAPFTAVWQLLADNPIGMFFGLGAGDVVSATSRLSYEAHDTTWMKLLVEYGVVGFIAYTAFLLRAIFRGSLSNPLSIGALVQLYLLGGNLLQPTAHLLVVMLVAIHRFRPAQSPNGSIGLDWTERFSVNRQQSPV